VVEVVELIIVHQVELLCRVLLVDLVEVVLVLLKIMVLVELETLLT
jgi:hypothetical protein